MTHSELQDTQAQKIKTYHWLLFTICFLATAFAGVVSTLMSVYLPVAVKDLLGDKTETDLNTISAYINAVFIIGGTVGGFAAGVMSDKTGRKKALITAIACLGIFTVLTGRMPNWWLVVICRGLSGVGLGAIILVTTVIMMEEWPKKTRAIFMGFLSISMPVGIFSAGLIDYFVSSWRQAFMIGIIPMLLAVLSAWILKESIQWQSNQSMPAEKNKSILFSAENKFYLFSGSVIFGAMLIGLWAIFSWLPTWIQGLVTTGDPQKPRGISMMMMGMGGLAGGFLSGWLINAIGSRRSMLLCFSVCFLMCCILFKVNTVLSPIVYAEILVLGLFFGASQGILSVYIPGLFSVAVRGMATGFCFNIGRIFTAVAVFFVGVLVTDLGGYSNALFVFSFVFLPGLIATYFGKEKENIDMPVVNQLSVE